MKPCASDDHHEQASLPPTPARSLGEPPAHRSGSLPPRLPPDFLDRPSARPVHTPSLAIGARANQTDSFNLASPRPAPTAPSSDRAVSLSVFWHPPQASFTLQRVPPQSTPTTRKTTRSFHTCLQQILVVLADWCYCNLSIYRWWFRSRAREEIKSAYHPYWLWIVVFKSSSSTLSPDLDVWALYCSDVTQAWTATPSSLTTQNRGIRCGHAGGLAFTMPLP